MTLRSLALACALACASLTAHAGVPLAQASTGPVEGVSDAKAALIRELLDVSGSRNMSKLVMDRVIQSVKDTKPKETHAAIDRLSAMLDMSELEGDLIRIYDKHMTEEDLRALLAFFRSPAGTKYLSKVPVMMSEAMSLGERWAGEKAQLLMEELSHEQAGEAGFLPKPPLKG